MRGRASRFQGTCIRFSFKDKNSTIKEFLKYYDTATQKEQHICLYKVSAVLLMATMMRNDKLLGKLPIEFKCGRAPLKLYYPKAEANAAVAIRCQKFCSLLLIHQSGG